MLKNVTNVLRQVASGAVRAEVTAAEAARLQKQLKKEQRPHRKTGRAQNSAIAIGGEDRIVVENIGYAKYQKWYKWARRIPYKEIVKIKRAWATRVRRALRGIQ